MTARRPHSRGWWLVLAGQLLLAAALAFTLGHQVVQLLHPSDGYLPTSEVPAP